MSRPIPPSSASLLNVQTPNSAEGGDSQGSEGPSRESTPLTPRPGSGSGHGAPPPPQSQSQSQSRSSSSQPKRRLLNKFACHNCQKKKTKCDGVRPICGACARRKDRVCEHPVREGAVSRYADLKQTYQQLERENHDLKDLLTNLRSRPENEAFELYRRLRGSDDPLRILQYFKDAESLLMLPSMGPGMAERWMSEADAEALASSPLKVPARPWTKVAGDGIVSNLISAWFKWDDSTQSPFVDKELFLRDMRNGDASPRTRYCSPLVVNAICALRSLLSESVKTISRATGNDLHAAFLAEAKRHLDSELSKMSFTTVQGLYILLLVHCCNGTNRVGSMYQLAALEMIRRMNIERTFARLNPSIPEEADRRRALSKLHWGVFLFECIMSESTQKPPAVPPPTIPMIFEERELAGYNLDVTGKVFGPGSPEPPLVPGASSAVCEVACLQHDVMLYNDDVAGSHGVGSEEDMRARRAFLARLGDIEASFSHRLGYAANPTPATMYLKLFMNMVAITILRPLPPPTRMLFDPSNPASHHTSAKMLMIRICAIDVDIVELYVRQWGLSEYAPMVFVGVWSVTCTLIAMLHGRTLSPVSADDDVSVLEMVPDLFTRACSFMRIFKRDMEAVRLIMQGLMVVAEKTQRVIPPTARVYFDGMDSNKDELKDVPVTTVLPVLEELRVLLDMGKKESSPDEDWEGRRSAASGGELAALLESWSSMSMGP